MTISSKTIAISAAAAIAILIVIVGVVFVVVNKRDSPSDSKVDKAVKSGLFKRCDKLSEPLEEIKISSCPDATSVGYCEIKKGAQITLQLNFTPVKNFNKATIIVSGLFDWKQDGCEVGIACPSVAGTKQKIQTDLTMESIDPARNWARINIIDPSRAYTKNQLFCVEFPVKLV